MSEDEARLIREMCERLARLEQALKPLTWGWQLVTAAIVGDVVVRMLSA